MPRSECVFEGCDKAPRRRGYCNGHHAQIMRGKPLTPLESRTRRTGTCSFSGCGHPENRWGLCAAHVAQRRRGTPLTDVRRVKDLPDTCTVDDCDLPHRSSGYCQAHYAQTLRGQEPHDFTPQGLPLAVRMERYTDKSQGGECWQWTGPLNDSGYGEIGVGGRDGEKVRAHRAAWIRAHGPIPTGMILDHLCGNRACVNPDHLRLATHEVNAYNRTVLSRNNTSGYRGVHRVRSGRWQARVTIGGQNHNLGVYDTPEEANEVACQFRSEHMGIWNGPGQRENWPRYRT